MARDEAYHSAEQKIEIARKLAAKEVDLGVWNEKTPKLTELPESLGQLTQLHNLELSNNPLTKLPEWLSQLKHLRGLDLTNIQLTVLPEWLGQLKHLRRLELTDNQLTMLPEFISELESLQKLSLHGNQLTILPDTIGRLNALDNLFLGDNQLAKLPETIGELKSLRGIYLFENQLKELPETIGGLVSLHTLKLSSNQLMELPATIGGLKSLQTLDLANNQLTALPESLTELNNLKELYLHQNPGLGIPDDILGPKSNKIDHKKAKPKPPKEILDYYFSTRGFTKRALNEAKLILVGRGGAGKTSLRRRLITGEWDEHEDKTPGIQVTAWPFKLGKDNVQLNVWDFGGQEIMHATHQFFLTKRSLYMLVLNAREGEQDANVEYWLRLIAGYGGGSPALVVINKCHQHPLDLDERGLREKFPFIRGFLRTDCGTKQGLKDLRDAIERETNALPDLRTPFPAEWFGLKRRLSELPGDCITYDEYRKLCQNEKEKDEKNQDVLISYLHDLGTVLHFRDDHRLNHLGVLKPNWVLEGIYGLLNADILKAASGMLQTAQLDELLDGGRYPQERHGFLIQLMEKFELCFELPGTARKRFLIPELLPKETPELAEWKSADPLRFEYHYDILPEGLLPRFIVRTHALSEGQKRWRSGVVLRQGEALALVRADVQDRLVTIAVCGLGRQPRELLAVVRGHFEEIHRGIAGLNADEIVPVPGYTNVGLDYRKLLVREANGKTMVEFETDKETIAMPLGKLLDNFEEPESRRERAKQGYSIDELTKLKGLMGGDNITQNFSGGDFTGPVAAKMENCTSIINQQSNGERRDLLKTIQHEAHELIAKLPADRQEEAADNLELLVKGADEKKPNRRWYSVSAEGLLEASKFVKDFTGNIAGTIGQLGKLLWPDFQIPDIKKTE